VLHRGIKELVDFREGDDRIEIAINLGVLHSQNRAIQVNVLTPREFSMKSGADLQ